MGKVRGDDGRLLPKPLKIAFPGYLPKITLALRAFFVKQLLSFLSRAMIIQEVEIPQESALSNALQP